jgi:GNAT superfamily N-acetyltransferase
MNRFKLFEEFIAANKIKCDNCGWTWNLSEGGDDLYICHKCFHDNTSILQESFVLKELEEIFNIKLNIFDNGKYLQLSDIVIPKEQRGKGIGSKVMQKIIDFADSQNKKIYLTPSTSFGASSVSRLEKFYKSFGFVKNKDKSETRDTMVRIPNQ